MGKGHDDAHFQAKNIVKLNIWLKVRDIKMDTVKKRRKEKNEGIQRTIRY